MPPYILPLKEKKGIADQTMAFICEKPTDLDFQPGQFMTLAYENPPFKDERGDRRSMSIASSPTETYIMFAMHMGPSAYKRSMQKATPGTILTGLGPFGKFTMPEDETIPLVFLAGGIGITPFRSMVKYATDKKFTRDITLVYCNFYLKDMAFLSELEQWEKENPNFHLVTTLTGEKDKIESEWPGRCGLIDEKMLKEVIPNITKPTYMIVGPPAMVDAMVNLLKKLNVPEQQITTEKFTGV